MEVLTDIDISDHTLAQELVDLITNHLSARAKEPWAVAIDGKTQSYSGEFDL